MRKKIVRTRKLAGSAFERDGRWILKARGIQRPAKGQTRKEALAELPQFVADILAGRITKRPSKTVAVAPEPERTLRTYAPEFLDRHTTAGEDRRKTRAAYRYRLEKDILPVLGNLTLPAVADNWPKVADHFRSLSKLKSPATVKLSFIVLRAMLNAAVRDGYLKANTLPTFAALKLAKSPRRKPKALTRAQVAALLGQAKVDPFLFTWCALMLGGHGLRPGEASGVQWGDIQGAMLHVERAVKVDEGQIWVGAPKNEFSVRKVPIGPGLVALLSEEHKRQERLLRELVQVGAVLPPEAFVVPHGFAIHEDWRKPADPRRLYGAFKAAAKRAGIPAATPHWLRHTAISLALAEGGSLADISARAGHADSAITAAVYSHALEGHASAACDDLLAPVAIAAIVPIKNVP